MVADYSYDPLNRLVSVASAGQTMSSDLANRLKTTTSGSTTTTYLYDGDGGRLQASTGTQASKKTNYLWDVAAGLPQVALERDGGGSLLRRYTYGAQRISMTAGSSTSYYIYDGLGSTANLTSSSGATQWTWSYEPFGSIRSETKANGNQPDNFMKFAGEYLDPTGLYHLRARQYDSASGRFLSIDPQRQSERGAALSPYQYAGTHPTVATDPSGLLFRPTREGDEAADFAGSLNRRRILLRTQGKLNPICTASATCDLEKIAPFDTILTLHALLPNREGTFESVTGSVIMARTRNGRVFSNYFHLQLPDARLDDFGQYGMGIEYAWPVASNHPDPIRNDWYGWVDLTVTHGGPRLKYKRAVCTYEGSFGTSNVLNRPGGGSDAVVNG